MATEASQAAVITVAGVPVQLTSNSPVPIAMATSRFPAIAASTAPEAHLEVRVARTSARPLDGVRWELHGDELRLDAGVFRATLHMERASATMDVSEDALTDWAPMRRAYEGLLYTLINRRDRHPIHAATIASDRSSLVLHGPSGVGKSTLAWEAHRDGLHVLSDDASRIQLSPELRVWGDGTPARIHLLEPVRERYASLRSLPAEPMGGDNEPKVTVDLRGDAGWTPYALNPRVVLLSRSGASRVTVTQVSADEIFAALMTAAEAELDVSPGNRERVLKTLAARGGFRLDLSPRAANAVPVLRELLASAPA